MNKYKICVPKGHLAASMHLVLVLPAQHLRLIPPNRKQKTHLLVLEGVPEGHLAAICQCDLDYWGSSLAGADVCQLLSRGLACKKRSSGWLVRIAGKPSAIHAGLPAHGAHATRKVACRPGSLFNPHATVKLP
jgi:hypothetical protein